MNRDTLDQLREVKTNHLPVALLTHLETGQQHLFRPGEVSALPAPFSGETGVKAADALRRDKSSTFDVEEGRVFIQVINPPLRMIIALKTQSI